ncbi:NACHT domain- and WD repeat-containing protein 1-like protein, partial [Leptotrombidium deliense]
MTTVTYDCQTVITGSQDMSLKVWEVSSGKITQVLVGHEESVSCVATAPFNSSMVISGSQDCNLIVWDMTTGSETFTLTGHTANVIDVKLSLDGTVAVSASEDNFLMVWEIADTGVLLSMIDMHHSFTSMAATLNVHQIVVQLTNNQFLPILRLHRNPAKEMVLDLLPGTAMQNDDKFAAALRNLRAGGIIPKRTIGRGHLKREQSFDSFYWDHMNRGVSIDDFRKISALSSQMGEREHLEKKGIIWEGSSERERG